MITFRKASLLAMMLATGAGMTLAACGGQPETVEEAPMAEPATAEPLPTEVPTEVPTEAPMASTDDIVTLIGNDPNLSTLADLLATAGLTETLKGAGPFTIFAPSNDAFAALPAGTLEALTPEQVVNILKYHVVAGSVMAADAAAMSGMTGESMAMNEDGTVATFTVTAMDGTVMINDATVTQADILGANGVIHIVDKVLMPGATGAEEEGAMDAAATPEGAMGEATAEGVMGEATAETGMVAEPTAEPTKQP